MGFFDIFKKEEKRSDEVSVTAVVPALDTVLARTLFGENGGITREAAMGIPAIASAVNIISGICASVPFKLYGFDENGKLCEKNDKRVMLINEDTGDLMNGYCTKKAFVQDYLLDGNGYIYINRVGNSIESLHYVRCTSVGVQKNEDEIFRRALYNVSGYVYTPYDFITIARNSDDGTTGRGITQDSAIVLRVVENMISMLSANLKSGGAKRGFLKCAKALSKDQMDKLKSDYAKLYSNEANMVILNSGLEFSDVAESATELQLSEFYEGMSSDVGEILGIPEGVIKGTADKDQYKNWFKSCISPLLFEIAASLNHTFLLESEKGKLFWKADTSVIESGDLKETFEALKIGVDSNFIQIDEARKKVGYEPTGFNMFKFGLDSVFVDPKSGKVYTPNTNAVWDINTGEVSGNGTTGEGQAPDKAPEQAPDKAPEQAPEQSTE